MMWWTYTNAAFLPSRRHNSPSKLTGFPQKSDNTIPWLFHDNLNCFHDFSAARIANAVLRSSSHIHHIYKDNCLVMASSSPYIQSALTKQETSEKMHEWYEICPKYIKPNFCLLPWKEKMVTHVIRKITDIVTLMPVHFMLSKWNVD